MQSRIEIQRSLRLAMQPTRAEVIAAKRVALNELHGSNPYLHAGTVLNHRLEALGIPIAPSADERLEVHEDRDPPFDADAPALVRRRTRVAVRQAMTELVFHGIAVELPGRNELRVPIRIVKGHSVGEDIWPIGVDTPLPEGEGRDRGEPTGEPVYILARAMSREPGLTVVDPDLFTADLGSLGLDMRARRCLEEALIAYRRGMYLSCVNLLGAVSEAAWYAAGEQLRNLDRGLANTLDSDRTEQVFARVAAVLKDAGSSRSGVDELLAHGGWLRRLRNYGVHPRGEVSRTEEHAFSEEATGLLLLQTHQYLVRLSEAVEKRIEVQ